MPPKSILKKNQKRTRRTNVTSVYFDDDQGSNQPIRTSTRPIKKNYTFIEFKREESIANLFKKATPKKKAIPKKATPKKAVLKKAAPKKKATPKKATPKNKRKRKTLALKPFLKLKIASPKLKTEAEVTPILSSLPIQLTLIELSNNPNNDFDNEFDNDEKEEEEEE